MIKFENVTLQYKDKAVLQDVNLTLEPGKIIGVIGRSGCGKTTLLKSFFDRSLIIQGELFYDDLNLCSKQNKKQIKQYKNQISFIDQEKLTIEEYDVYHNLLWHFNDYQNIIYKWFKLLNKAQRQLLLDKAKDLGVEHLLFKPIQNLSTGQKQRVNILMHLMLKFNLLLADEPTSNLDAFWSEKTMINLAQEAKQGKYVIMAIHNLELAMKYCDVLIAIEDHRINHIFTKQEFNKERLEKYFDVRED
ncbi:ATP-binding cassette domain-containing protein [Mycoplasma hafezii]|uniref:ATP-binding cassette domain-containing protein n=1 Tax=Mycoplasma hafezii TaxID=525886 RepID=UPI003CEC342D